MWRASLPVLLAGASWAAPTSPYEASSAASSQLDDLFGAGAASAPYAQKANQAQIQSQSSDLPYNEADFLVFLGAVHEHLDPVLHIGLDIVGAVEGLDVGQLLNAIGNWRLSPLLDYLQKRFGWPDITRLLQTAKQTNLSVFVPFGISLLTKSNLFSQNPLVTLENAPYTGNAVLKLFAKLDFHPLAQWLKTTNFVDSFKAATGLDASEAVDNMGRLTGRSMLADFSGMSGAEVGNFLDDSGLMQYIDLLGLELKEYLDRLAGMTGADILRIFADFDAKEWINKVRGTRGAPWYMQADNIVNALITTVRAPFVDGRVKIRGVRSAPLDVPAYSGFNTLRFSRHLQDFVAGLVGFRGHDWETGLRAFSVSQLRSNILALTATDVAGALNAMFKNMGPVKQDALVKWFVDVADMLWTRLYTTTGSQVMNYVYSTTGPKLLETVKAVDVAFLPTLALNYGIADTVYQLTGVNFKPLLQEGASLKTATILDNLRAVTGDDIVELMENFDIFNIIESFGFHSEPLVEFVQKLNASRVFRCIDNLDGPQLMDAATALRGPDIVRFVNRYVNIFFSLMLETVHGKGFRGVQKVNAGSLPAAGDDIVNALTEVSRTPLTSVHATTPAFATYRSNRLPVAGTEYTTGAPRSDFSGPELPTGSPGVFGTPSPAADAPSAGGTLIPNVRLVKNKQLPRA